MMIQLDLENDRFGDLFVYFIDGVSLLHRFPCLQII